MVLAYLQVADSLVLKEIVGVVAVVVPVGWKLDITGAVVSTVGVVGVGVTVGVGAVTTIGAMVVAVELDMAQPPMPEE